MPTIYGFVFGKQFSVSCWSFSLITSLAMQKKAGDLGCVFPLSLLSFF